MNFGDKLKQLRQARGLSQPELAEAASIEQSYLSKLENGRSVPSAEVLRKLMAALDVSMEQLLDGIDDAEVQSRLNGIPEIGSHIQSSAAERQSRQRRILLVSLLATGLGFALLVGGGGALLFPDVQYRYEFVSEEVVPKGDDGQTFDSLEAYVRYQEGQQEPGQDSEQASFGVRVNRELQKLGSLQFSAYLMEDEFEFSRFHRDASPTEQSALQAAGFENGGSRFFQFSQRHEIDRPENGYVFFLGLLLTWMGAAGVAYALAYNRIGRSR